MCPTCSAIYCQECIDKLPRTECPTCKAPRTKESYARCRPVEETIRDIQIRQNLRCENHRLEKVYFCLEESCRKPLCPDCYFDEHLGHPKKLFIDEYTERKHEVESTMGTFNQKLSHFESLQTEMKEKVEEARKFET